MPYAAHFAAALAASKLTANGSMEGRNILEVSRMGN
jgi:hypothetical protein